MVSVSLRGVTRTFGDGTCALRDVNLRAGPGELVVITGPSGAGKTTILRLIAGLDEPTEGDVLIDDRIVNGVRTRDRDVALVASDQGLYPHLTTEENLAFALRMRGVSADETRRRVHAEARVLGLRGLLHRKPRVLAPGQRQRVALGRATTRVPRVFLLDEPLGPLDAHERLRIRSQFASLRAGLGVTTLYVTHDQQEAMALGDRIAVLDRGMLQQVAHPGELYTRPANVFVATFMGSPSMNVFQAQLEGDGTVSTVRLGRTRLALTDTQRRALGARRLRHCIIGVRPESVHRFGDRSGVADRRVDLHVLAVERLGGQMHVTGELLGDAPAPSATLTAALPAASRPETGDIVALALDVAALHVFDPTTGAAVLHGAAAGLIR